MNAMMTFIKADDPFDAALALKEKAKEDRDIR